MLSESPRARHNQLADYPRIRHGLGGELLVSSALEVHRCRQHRYVVMLHPLSDIRPLSGQ